MIISIREVPTEGLRGDGSLEVKKVGFMEETALKRLRYFWTSADGEDINQARWCREGWKAEGGSVSQKKRPALGLSV
jgi:hypothetical protein